MAGDSINKKNRKNFVFDRDGDRCVYCEADQRSPLLRSRTHLPPIRLTLDHLIPASQGGPNTRTNLVTSCNRCNQARGTTDIVTWLQSLRPMETITGGRAVHMVRKALESGEREDHVDTLYQRLKVVFRDVR